MNTLWTLNREPKRAEPAPQPQALTDDLEDGLLTLAPYAVAGLALAASAVAAVAITLAQPAWLSSLAASLAGVEPKAYWYLSRSSAIVGYVMLWASMVLGLAITNKMARAWPGGPTYAALHEHTSWLGLVLSAFHALILLGDGYIGYNLNQLLVPFASAGYRPLWVGLGQVALYLLAFVVLSFYLRRWIGYRLWRTIHYLSFAVFGLGMLHGLMSGTDTAGLAMLGVYWASALSVVGLLVYRIKRSRPQLRPTAS
jgi:predicted ferric reductase